MTYAITAAGITMSFGAHKVLDGIDMKVPAGEIFGLLGPSGAGKTTLIKILTGQTAPDSGTASINGSSSDRLTGADRMKFGIMMDDFGVYERLSCFDNLKLFARIYGLDDSRIKSVLEKVGLGESAKKPASALSKGMTGRLRLARAFMTDPYILFLDEPTSGLDPAAADAIHRMILAEKSRGRTVFLTTHDMAEAAKLCDHIALLNDGTIVEQGSPAEICRKYDHQRRLKIHLSDGSDTELPYGARAAAEIAELISSGRAETIHTTEPDLETVFMELTGKELSA